MSSETKPCGISGQDEQQARDWAATLNRAGGGFWFVREHEGHWHVEGVA